MSIDSTLEHDTRSQAHSARASVPAGPDSGSSTSTTGLISSLATDIGELMRSELQLARVEISESIDSAKAGLVSMGVGAAVLLAGVLTLIAFLVLGVADWFDIELWVGALLVGSVATIAGLVMVKGGSSRLSTEALSPTRTRHALGKDKQMIEEKTA